MSKELPIVAIIPAYGEEATIAKVILETQKYVSKVIVCDDGSKDMTGKVAATSGAIVINHKTNLGKGATLRSLFVEAMKTKAKAVITLDADGQHDPKEILRLVKAMQKNGADIVVGSRFKNGGSPNNQMPIGRILGNKLLSVLTDGGISDTQSGFRLYRKNVLRSIMPRETGMGADSEILMKAREKGLRIIEVPINVKYNVPNPSKKGPLASATEVVVSVIRYLSVRKPQLFYGVPAIETFIVALGFWTGTIQQLGKTGQIDVTLSLIAIAATIVSLVLLTATVIPWMRVRAVRVPSNIKTTKP